MAASGLSHVPRPVFLLPLMETCTPIDKRSPAVSLSAKGELSQCPETQDGYSMSAWSLEHPELLLSEMAVPDGSGVSGHSQS